METTTYVMDLGGGQQPQGQLIQLDVSGGQISGGWSGQPGWQGQQQQQWTTTTSQQQWGSQPGWSGQPGQTQVVTQVTGGWTGQPGQPGVVQVTKEWTTQQTTWSGQGQPPQTFTTGGQQQFQQVGGGVEVVSGALNCFNCNLNLTGYRYILRDEKPFCIKCYETLFANKCEECKAPIGTDHKDLSYKDKHWHEGCFKCFDCKASLVDRSFAFKNDKTYCPDCHDNNFAIRCDGCNNIFRAGMKKYEFKGKQFHEQCFSCKVCRQPIGTKTFIPRDQEVVCVPCYEEQYAQRCVKCNGVINKGGITYKNTPWHRECFTCVGCNRMLTGEKFTSREEKPFCSECFAQYFAKKCCRCVRPITGLGTTKFISFDDRHWHTDCFSCYKCNSSLVGRGFLVTGADVLCPECGRA